MSKPPDSGPPARPRGRPTDRPKDRSAERRTGADSPAGGSPWAQSPPGAKRLSSRPPASKSASPSASKTTGPSGHTSGRRPPRRPELPPNSRAAAAQAVARVLGGASLDDALARVPVFVTPADAALVRVLAYGVLRELSPLQWLAVRLADRPMEAGDALSCLLYVGLYQLHSLGTPDHAAINETVDAVDALGQPSARGFLNAVLRRYTRERDALRRSLPSSPMMRFAHPAWLVERIRADWPRDWEAVLAANNAQAPLTLRVNRRRIVRDEYLKRLAEMQIAAEPVAASADGVTLAEPRGVERIPGFKTGQVSVQDASAQLAADLLDLRDGQRVLDACAAPGGKTAHLLERAEVEVVAVDIDSVRLARVDANLQRLKLQAQLIAGDAAQPQTWWDHRPFERILIDAPCSGTGVIRRHPDIKWLRREDDIPALQQRQLALLKSLWGLLKPRGRLVYATCSILRDEGDEVVKRFCVLHADARVERIDASWGEATEYGRRIAPGGAHDGFYYAVLTRHA